MKRRSIDPNRPVTSTKWQKGEEKKRPGWKHQNQWNTGNKLMKLHYRFSLPRKHWAKGRREGEEREKIQPTSATSCLVWTASLLSTHSMHIHKCHRKPSTSGTSLKTLPCQLVLWTRNSTAPLWPKEWRQHPGKWRFFLGRGGCRRGEAGTQPCERAGAAQSLVTAVDVAPFRGWRAPQC